MCNVKNIAEIYNNRPKQRPEIVTLINWNRRQYYNQRKKRRCENERFLDLRQNLRVNTGELGKFVKLRRSVSVLTGPISVLLWVHSEVRVCEISLCLRSVSCRGYDVMLVSGLWPDTRIIWRALKLSLSRTDTTVYLLQCLVYTLESLYSTEMTFINDPRVFNLHLKRNYSTKHWQIHD